MPPFGVLVHLTEQQVKELVKLACSDESRRIRERASYVLMRADRKTYVQIAKVFYSHPETISRWIREYMRKGTKGLIDKPKSGRPRKLMLKRQPLG
jgi:transposase